MNRLNDPSKGGVDFLKWAQRLALVLASLVVAVFVFNTIRGMVRSTDIIDFEGLSIQPTAVGAETTPGESTQVVIAPPDIDGPPSLLPDDWDGASRVNILVMGLDYRDWEAGLGAPRTDTMIVLTIDPVNETAGILSLPRDLWVNIPGFYFDRINEAYSLGEGAKLPGGGAGLAMRTVEEFLGIDIHYYAQIDFNTFEQFVDFIGGVKVTITEPIELEIKGKKKDVVLEPGNHTLGGPAALAFVRNRSTGDGDIGRAERQQQVIISIQKQLLRADVQKLILEHAAELWDVFSAGIKTNIGFDEAFRLGFLALKINLDSIARGVIAPPDYAIPMTTPDGKSILKPITAKVRELRDQMFADNLLFGPAASGDLFSLMKAENAKVAVYNGSGVAGLAGSTQEYLLGQGLNVVEIGNFDYVPATTIYDYTGNPYTVKFLIDLMGIQPTRIFSRYDPTSAIDVAVVLGSDWVVP